MKFRVALIPIALLLATGAQAEIYKCVAEDGSVSYSQIPCPKQVTTEVRAAVPKTDGAVDCRWATQFANEVGRQMRSGMPSESVFGLYGGIDSVSAGTINIINYVFRFRGNATMPLERISSLAGSMCKAGSLGDVRCASLPYGQDPTGDRCDPDFADDSVDAVAAHSTQGTTHAGEDDITLMAGSNIVAGSNMVGSNMAGSNDAAREQCRNSYRDQIDDIDAQMRSGYDSAQGEVYRERLRVLTKNLRAC